MTTHEVLTDTVEDIKLQLAKVKNGFVDEHILIEIIDLSETLITLAQEALDEF